MGFRNAYLLTCRVENEDFPYSREVYDTASDGIESFYKRLVHLSSAKMLPIGSETETVLRRLQEYSEIKDGQLCYKAKIFSPSHEKSVYVQLSIIRLRENRYLKDSTTISQCELPEGMEMRIGEFDVDPCLYEIVQRVENVTVEISRCKHCGKTEIAWIRQDNSVDLPQE